MVRVAQDLARAATETGAAASVAHEVTQIRGIAVSAVYLVRVASGELVLAAHEGEGTRVNWERPPAVAHRAARSEEPRRGTTVDEAQLAVAGVGKRAIFAIPLMHAGTQLGVLVVGADQTAPLDPTALSTVAALTGAAVATMRRLAASLDEARRDPLTGLPNKRAFRELVGSALDPTRSSSASVSLVLFDIDDFKLINDTRGHPAGDRVLRQLARVTLRSLRSGEEAFRVGGEEFAIVVLEPLDVAVRVAERIRKALSESTREPLPTISAGVAELAPGSGGCDELVAAADAALYEAKGHGKDRVVAAGERPRLAATQSAARPRTQLLSVALLELPVVARSWLLAEDDRVTDGELLASCRYVAGMAGGVGAAVSLIAGSRLVLESRWLDPSLGHLAPSRAPMLTRVEQVPLLGAPRLLRDGAGPHVSADVRVLRELRVASALMLGIRAGSAALGVVEVYARERNAFAPNEVQLASLAARQPAAHLAQRQHADELRRRYRRSVISLCAVASGAASLGPDLDESGRVCRSVAEACGLERRAAFACELGGILTMAARHNDALGEAIPDAVSSSARQWGGQGIGSWHPLLIAARIPATLYPSSVAGGEHLSREASIVEVAIDYQDAVHRHGAGMRAREGALRELVHRHGPPRDSEAIEALVRLQGGLLADAGESG